MKFKVGDKVRLNQHVCSQDELNIYASDGSFGITYTIIEINRYQGLRIRLKGSNWHHEDWLVRVIEKPLIGGELV